MTEPPKIVLTGNETPGEFLAKILEGTGHQKIADHVRAELDKPLIPRWLKIAALLALAAGAIAAVFPIIAAAIG